MTTTLETPAAEASEDTPEPTDSRRRFRVDPASAVQLVAIVPLAAMLLLVLDSSKLQWLDYWSAITRVTNPDGSLAETQLFAYHEGHILAVPSVVYWLNYKLTSGLNTTLGVFVVALVAAQVLMLRRLLPRPSAIGRWWFAAGFVALSALLFASQGAHNFSRAMSGTAWLLANFFAIGALLVASRFRSREWLVVALAAPLAVLATLSYGTGLMTWVALLVFVFLLRPRARSTYVLAGGAAVALGWYFAEYDRPPSQSAVALDLTDIGRRIVQVLGSALLPDASGAVVVGALGIVLAVALSVLALRADRGAAAPWVALAVYAVLGAAMIGVARGGVVGDDVGTSSRYYSLSALLWAALVVLAIIARPRDPRVLGFAAVAGIVAFVGGGPAVATVRESVHNQDELAIAIRLGVSQNYSYWWGFDRDRPFLQQIDHYPFSSAFDADCGRLGDDLPASDVRPLEGDVHGEAETIQTGYSTSAVRVTGWVSSPYDPVRCVLVLDGDGDVVGAGAYGIERDDLVAAGVSPTGDFDIGFTAVAPSLFPEYRIVAELESGELYELPENLERPSTPAA